MSPFFNNRGQNIVTAYDRKIKIKQIKPGIKTNQPRLNETRNVYLYSSNAVDRTLFFFYWWCFSPWRLRFSQRGFRFSPSGLRFSPWALRFSRRGLRLNPRGLRFSPRGLRSSFLGLRFRNTPCPAPLWILIEWFNNGQICLLVTVARYWIYYGAGFRTLLAAV